jgi:hypothetical protein
MTEKPPERADFEDLEIQDLPSQLRKLTGDGGKAGPSGNVIVQKHGSSIVHISPSIKSTPLSGCLRLAIRKFSIFIVPNDQQYYY